MNEEAFEGKNLVELLDMLEPVPEPAAISMWPQTQGWIWAGLLLVALILWGLWRWRVAHQANAYRRAALSLLDEAADDPVQIASILRRTALSAYPRSAVAGLSGEAWLAFLDAHYDGPVFSSDAGRDMLAAPYRADAKPVTGLAKMARNWVRNHRPEANA